MKDFIVNPRKYARCGEAGREYFRKNFRWEAFMKSLKAEIMSVTGSSRSPDTEKAENGLRLKAADRSYSYRRKRNVSV